MLQFSPPDLVCSSNRRLNYNAWTHSVSIEQISSRPYAAEFRTPDFQFRGDKTQTHVVLSCSCAAQTVSISPSIFFANRNPNACTTCPAALPCTLAPCGVSKGRFTPQRLQALLEFSPIWPIPVLIFIASHKAHVLRLGNQHTFKLSSGCGFSRHV